MKSRSWLCATLWVISLASPAGAQESPRPARRAARWSVVYTLGGVHGGPNADLMANLARSGYGETVEPRFGCDPQFSDCEPDPYPRGKDDDTKRRMLDVGFAAREHLWVHLLFAEGPGGEAVGFRETPTLFPSVMHRSNLVAGIAQWRAGPVRVGAGPALATVHTTYIEDVDELLGRSTRRLIGAVADGGLAVPLGAHVFLDGRAQYRAFPKVRFDAFSDGTGPRIARAKASFSHRYLALGLGARW